MSTKSAIFLSRESLNENGKERVGIDFRFLSLSVRPEEGGPDNDQCTRLAGVNSSACDRGHEGGDRRTIRLESVGHRSGLNTCINSVGSLVTMLIYECT